MEGWISITDKLPMMGVIVECLLSKSIGLSINTWKCYRM
jgi:hypothetical protein